MIGIFKKILYTLFTKKYKSVDYTTYLQFENDISKNIILQQIENDKIKRGIEKEAKRWIEEDKNGYIGIRIMYPFISHITIYHSETAKYKNTDIRELVIIEYNKLKEELC